MHVLTRLFAAGLCAAAAASAVHAQNRLAAAPQNGTRPASAPSADAQAARAAPQAGGLQSAFPAGLNAGSGAAASTDPIARSTSPVPAGLASIGTGTDMGSPDRDTVTNGSAGRSGGITILPFEEIDRNADGVITRAEYSDVLR